MIRVAALTSGRHVPSARFRIRQHLAPLRGLGVEVAEYCPFISQYARLPGALGKMRQRYLAPITLGQTILTGIARIPGVLGARKSDVTWVERNFLPGLDDLVRLTRSPRVLDMDDAVWLSDPLGPRSAGRFARQFDAIIAGNAYLADWYSKHCSKVFVVPTAIDCERFKPSQDKVSAARASEKFVIGWTGTAGNFKYLEAIERPLARFLRDHASASLKIIADRKPSLRSIPEDRINFVAWDSDAEVAGLRDMDVGLMPLEDTEWTRGKCSFKMLQYMAMEMPVIVSMVGMNAEILKLGECGIGIRREAEWLDALTSIYENEALRARMGRVGRELAVSSFSVPVVAQRLANVFAS